MASKNKLLSIVFSNKVRNTVFYFCYTLLLFEVFFRHTSIVNPITHGTYQWIALPLLGALSLINFAEAKTKGKILSVIVIAFGVATRLIANDNSIFTVTLFVCAFKDVKFDSLLKLSICVKITLLVVLAFLYFNGLTDRGAVIQNGVIRHSMGFGNPNTFSTHIFSIIIQTFYLHRNRFKWMDALVFVVGVASIYGFAHSKTQILCAVLAIGIFAIKKILCLKNKIVHKTTKIVLCGAFAAGAALSLSAIYAYMINPTSMEALNKISSKRISSAVTVIKQNDGIALFGKKVDRSVKQNNAAEDDEGPIRVFDNGYAYISMYFGIFSLCVFAAIFCVYNDKSTKKDDGRTAWALMVYAITGVTEHFFIEVAMNIFLLKYAELVYGCTEERNSIC